MWNMPRDVRLRDFDRTVNLSRRRKVDCDNCGNDDGPLIICGHVAICEDCLSQSCCMCGCLEAALDEATEEYFCLKCRQKMKDCAEQTYADMQVIWARNIAGLFERREEE